METLSRSLSNFIWQKKQNQHPDLNQKRVFSVNLEAFVKVSRDYINPEINIKSYQETPCSVYLLITKLY